MPPSEHVHWWFATGFLVLALCFAARAAVGAEVCDRRPRRRYLFPGVLFAMGLLMFPVMVFFTNSTIHMVAHGSWAETMMLAGGAQLGLAAGKLKSPLWNLTLRHLPCSSAGSRSSCTSRTAGSTRGPRSGTT